MIFGGYVINEFSSYDFKIHAPQILAMGMLVRPGRYHRAATT
jgi:hypothetical protein